MSRRVSESSPQRKQAQAIWGVEDLRERPAAAASAGAVEYATRTESGFEIADSWSQFVLANSPSGDYDTDTPTFDLGGSGDIEVGKAGVYHLVFWIQPDSTNANVVTETNFEVRHQSGAAWDTMTGDAQALTNTSRYFPSGGTDAVWDVPPVVVPFAIQQGSIDNDGPAVLRFSALIQEDGNPVVRDCTIRYWFTRLGGLYSGL